MKKIISFLLCISLILSTALVSSAYTANDSMKILKSLGVIQGDPNGNLRENDLVKRSEFAKMAVLLSQHKNKLSLNSKLSVFTDCTASHWAAPYVRTAAENGIIEGYSNGLFGPDDYINYAQAVTIALRLLGYTDEDFGFTYPQGQLGMAQSLKLGEGLLKSANDLLTRADVAQVFKNMLLTNKKGTKTNYIESIEYSIKEDTIIIATNNEDPSVAPGKVFTTSGEFTIDGNFDASLVGKKGSAVINSEGKLLTLIENSGKIQKYAVYSASTDFVSLIGSNGSLTLRCDDGTLSYKGTQKTTFGTLKNEISTGDVLIVGINTNGSIDYLISGKSDFNGPYTVQKDSSLPAGGDFSAYSVIKNGSTSSLSAIKKNDIVYISSSLSSLFVYSKKASGIYSKAVPNIDSPESVIVGGKEYKIESPLAFSKLSSGGCKIGDNLVLLLGRDGRIADVLGYDNASSQSYAGELKKDQSTTPAPLALLSALGSLDLENGILQNAEAPITRGEFAKMAVMSSTHRNSVSLGSKLSVFADCTSSHPMSPYIKVAAENKLMSAYSDSLFYPQKGISLAESLDAVLKISGYSDTDFSDWPSSQMSIAKQKGITNGISKTANDEITKAEAATIIYNALCATNKQGSVKGIEQLGYTYYDDAVIIATNTQNSSVPSGKVLTSEGTFSIDSQSFDQSLVGKTGELLIYSGKVQMFNKSSLPYTENIILSSAPGGLLVSDQNKTAAISVPDSAVVYIDATKTIFSQASSSIAVGDTAYICYDNSSRLKYIHINTSSLKGPFVVTSPSGWYAQISGASQSSRIMKNGYQISSSALSVNDILYFSPALNTAYAYSDKVIGILESASPSKEAPNTVKVSGKSYQLESSNASFINISYGDVVVLCLGRNGKVANSYSGSQTEIAGYLTATGVKEFTNSNGESYTSNYARLVLADGTYIDCATDSSYEGWKNKIMSAKFANGKAKLSVISSPGTVYGAVNASNLKIGSTPISPNVKILDAGYIEKNEPASCKATYLQRIDGLNFAKSDVLYAKVEGGQICELILNNVTGDALSYGIITSANSKLDGFNASGSYSCDIGGSTYSYSGGVYSNLSKGSVVSAVLSGGRAVSFKKLNVNSGTVKEIGYTSVVLSNGTELFLSDEVAVYKRTGSYEYTHLPLSEVVENPSAYSSISVYTDKAQSKGGRVRIILVR